jgi:hypothetical protein
VSKPQTTQFTNWDATLEGHEGKVEIDDDRNSRIEKRPQALAPGPERGPRGQPARELTIILLENLGKFLNSCIENEYVAIIAILPYPLSNSGIGPIPGIGQSISSCRPDDTQK